jgi:hypothetical protein
VSKLDQIIHVFESHHPELEELEAPPLTCTVREFWENQDRMRWRDVSDLLSGIHLGGGYRLSGNGWDVAIMSEASRAENIRWLKSRSAT